MVSEQEETLDSASSISAAIIFIMLILLFNDICLAKLKDLTVKKPKYLKYLLPTTFTTFLGALIKLTNTKKAHEIMHSAQQGFSSIFLIALLPPIIFESAINIEIKYFWKNIICICNYAIFGTVIACLITALILYPLALAIGPEITFLECLAFGAFISSTDPVSVLSIFKVVQVNKDLYAMIYGESTLNDAVCIVLFNSLVKFYLFEGKKNETNIIIEFIYIFSFSLILGFLIGLLTSYVINLYQLLSKQKQDNEQSKNKQYSIIFFVPWIGYLFAQSLELSGICAILICGFTIKQYGMVNLSDEQKINVQQSYHFVACYFEDLVYIFIGISFFALDMKFRETGFLFLLLAIVVIILARVISIGLLSWIMNSIRSEKISKLFQGFLVFSGLRGAMGISFYQAFALAIESVYIFQKNDNGKIMLTITLVFCIFNLFIQVPFLPQIIQKNQEQIGWKPQFDFNIINSSEFQNMNSETQQQIGFFQKIDQYLQNKLKNKTKTDQKQDNLSDESQQRIMNMRSELYIEKNSQDIQLMQKNIAQSVEIQTEEFFNYNNHINQI